MTGRALLFTDLVDSTLLVERLGDARAAKVWVEHDRRARDLLARHRGREIDRTDGFLLLFDDPADAARYALAYHQALADLALSARAGLHVGPVTLRENAPEFSQLRTSAAHLASSNRSSIQVPTVRTSKAKTIDGSDGVHAVQLACLFHEGSRLVAFVSRAPTGLQRVCEPCTSPGSIACFQCDLP